MAQDEYLQKVATKYMKENTNREVVKLVQIVDRSSYRDAFLCLEWFRDYEYVIRPIYNFTKEVSEIGIGSGEYIQLFMKEEDYEEAIRRFNTRVEEELATKTLFDIAKKFVNTNFEFPKKK